MMIEVMLTPWVFGDVQSNAIDDCLFLFSSIHDLKNRNGFLTIIPSLSKKMTFGKGWNKLYFPVTFNPLEICKEARPSHKQQPYSVRE